jgi:predicted RNase H-like HicB family nuclease
MKRRFTASVWREDRWYVAQCLEVDVASQGKSEEQALVNLREALELYFEPPTPTLAPHIHSIEAEIGVAIAIVPHHREVSVGVLRSILRQA